MSVKCLSHKSFPTTVQINVHENITLNFTPFDFEKQLTYKVEFYHAGNRASDLLKNLHSLDI